MGVRHAHFCTNDCPLLLNGFSSCTWFYEWLFISFWMGFRHAYFCTNDYPFLLNGFSSCTCFYEWLSNSCEWVFVMYMFLRMTINFIWMGFRHVHFCTDDYVLILNRFLSYPFLYKWLPPILNWFSSYTCLYEWLSIFLYIDFCHAYSLQMTFHILLVFHDVCNALQRVSSMVHWRIINNITMHIGFWPCA